MASHLLLVTPTLDSDWLLLLCSRASFLATCGVISPTISQTRGFKGLPSFSCETHSTSWIPCWTNCGFWDPRFLSHPCLSPPPPKSNTGQPSCPWASCLSQGGLGAGHAPSGTWTPTTGESITHFLPILLGAFVFNILRSYRVPSSKCTNAFGVLMRQCSTELSCHPQLSHWSPLPPSGTMSMDTRPVLSHDALRALRLGPWSLIIGL